MCAPNSQLPFNMCHIQRKEQNYRKETNPREKIAQNSRKRNKTFKKGTKPLKKEQNYGKETNLQKTEQNSRKRNKTLEKETKLQKRNKSLEKKQIFI